MTRMTVYESSQVSGQSAGGRIALGVVLSLLTAAMLVLAFPPYNLWPLAFICLVPMLIAKHRLLPMRWTALAESLGASLWVLIMLTALFGLHLETWFIQGIAVATVVMNLLTNRAARRFHDRTHHRWFVLGGALDWVGFEMIRSFIPLIRTNLFAAHMVHTQPWLVAPVSVFSIYGLNLLVILVNYAVAQGVFALIDRRWRWEGVPLVDVGRARRWVVGIAGVFVAWSALGGLMLAAAPTDAPIVRVASTPHDFPNPGHLDAPENQAARLASLTEQTRLAAERGAQLVVWPELAVGFEPQAEYSDELSALTPMPAPIRSTRRPLARWAPSSATTATLPTRPASWPTRARA